jgi:hypothetical protein
MLISYSFSLFRDFSLSYIDIDDFLIFIDDFLIFIDVFLIFIDVFLVFIDVFLTYIDDLGIAFRLPEFKSGAKFHPCFTLSSRAKITLMFGPAFSFDPKFVYGLNTQCTSTQASDMIGIIVDINIV